MKKATAIQSAPARSAEGTTKKLVVLALLSALGFISMMLIKLPVVSFLKYEPKDIFLTLAGFLYGPLAALACSVVTGLLELPFSSTGIIGMVMNILSSAAFACTASLIYKKRRDLYGAVIGLLCGVAVMTVTMLLWNYLISPLYMGVTREQIVPMLTAVFLPFNLLKSGINAALTLLIYRPFLRVLQRCGYSVSDHYADRRSSNIVIFVTAALLFCGCVGVIIWMNKG